MRIVRARKSRAPLLVAGLAAGLALPAAPASAASARQDRVERAVLAQVNAVRAQAGLQRLKRSRPLARTADQTALDVLATRTLSHTSPDGTPMDARLRRSVRARAVGETLAAVPAGRGEASAVVAAWLGSPPHRAQLLSPAFRRAGLGRRRGSLGGGRMAVVTLDLASAR